MIDLNYPYLYLYLYIQKGTRITSKRTHPYKYSAYFGPATFCLDIGQSNPLRACPKRNI